MLPKLFAADSVLRHSSWPQCLDRTWQPWSEVNPALTPLRHQIYLRGKSGFRVSFRRGRTQKKKIFAPQQLTAGTINILPHSLSDRFATISFLYTIFKSRKFKLILCFSVENIVGLCYCCTKRTMEGQDRKKFRSVLFDSLWRSCLTSPWMNDVKMFSFAKQNS